MRKMKLLLFLAAFSVIVPSAQSQSQGAGESAKAAKPVCKFAATKEMTRSINLPDVPIFPGAKFISGEQAEPNGEVICACTVEYSIPKNSVSQVIPFYANALNGGGWKIAQHTSTSVDASNEGNNSHCNVGVDSSDEKLGKIYLNYACVAKASSSGL